MSEEKKQHAIRFGEWLIHHPQLNQADDGIHIGMESEPTEIDELYQRFIQSNQEEQK